MGLISKFFGGFMAKKDKRKYKRLHKVRERIRSKKGPDVIVTECGEMGFVKGGWEYVNCEDCLKKRPKSSE